MAWFWSIERLLYGQATDRFHLPSPPNRSDTQYHTPLWSVHGQRDSQWECWCRWCWCALQPGDGTDGNEIQLTLHRKRTTRTAAIYRCCEHNTKYTYYIPTKQDLQFVFVVVVACCTAWMKKHATGLTKCSVRICASDCLTNWTLDKDAPKQHLRCTCVLVFSGVVVAFAFQGLYYIRISHWYSTHW